MNQGAFVDCLPLNITAEGTGKGVWMELRVYVYPQGNGYFYHIRDSKQDEDGLPVNGVNAALSTIESLWQNAQARASQLVSKK